MDKEMSPQELADISGILPSHLSKIINGKRRCISLPVAFKISIALQMPIEDIFIFKQPVQETDND